MTNTCNNYGKNERNREGSMMPLKQMLQLSSIVNKFPQKADNMKNMAKLA